MNTKIEDKEKPILETCLRDTHDLLTTYWRDITKIRDAKDAFVSVSMSFKVDCTGECPMVKTRIGFSRRFKAERETDVNLEQTVFPFLENAGQLRVA
jgi:hypothetical protein